MMIDVFFNRPYLPLPTDRLIGEVRRATRFLGVASAWFTDTEIAQAFIDAPAPRKFMVLNSADISRGDKRAFKMVREYMASDKVRKAKESYDALRNKIEEDAYHSDSWEWGEVPRPTCPIRQYELQIRGSEDWTKGVMHHKFIVIDLLVVWTGSYNFTFQARQNFETLIRIEDYNVASRFVEELYHLSLKDDTASDNTNLDFYAGGNTCVHCLKDIRFIDDVCTGNYGSTYCRSCFAQYYA